MDFHTLRDGVEPLPVEVVALRGVVGVWPFHLVSG